MRPRERPRRVNLYSGTFFVDATTGLTQEVPPRRKGLYYSAGRNGVYILRLTVEAGQLNPAAAAPLHAAMTTEAPALLEADPEEEALAALERPHGEHCSIPLGD